MIDGNGAILDDAARSAPAFRGRLVPYTRRRSMWEWGACHLDNRDRALRRRPLHPGPCPLCALVTEPAPTQPVSFLEFAGETILAIQNNNPIVEGHLLLFPPPAPEGWRLVEHRIDLDVADFELILTIAATGFDGLSIRPDPRTSGIPVLDEASAVRTRPWAVYVNAFPGTGRSVEHLHLNGVPAHHVPLPPWPVAPWSICADRSQGTTMSRLAGAPFYAIAVEGATAPDVAATLARLHAEMNRWQVPYNLIAWPRGGTGGDADAFRVAVVPRGAEHCEAADQKVAGLEFLTGVLIPGRDRLGAMSAIHRAAAFRQASLADAEQLALERRLRGAFDTPASGCAVVPIGGDDGSSGRPTALRPVVRPNTVLDDPALAGRWSDAAPAGTRSYDAMRREANVLVRITRASICQSDRRVLLGTKPSTLATRPYVLGHEAGGYVVDPGPWAGELHAGRKVVVLPHLTCGRCRACRAYMQNQCEHMRHLGFHLHGSLADLMCFPFQCILPVPDEFPDDALPLVEPVACVLRALFRIKEPIAEAAREATGDAAPAQPFTIYGAGPMGCLAARAVRRFWPGLLIHMVDPDPERRRLVDRHGIADTVAPAMAPGATSRIGFVASSTLQATADAIASARPGGTVLLFSGINVDDLARDHDGLPLDAAVLERTHRFEETLEEELPARLVGSSGYGFDDSARSVVELGRHHDHYGVVQNVIIDGLDADRAVADDGGIAATGAPGSMVVETFLSPAGIEDAENGTTIARTIKVLIRM
jgi:threonine dehydrogenase-like Zn-dependent dehydrogenase